MDDTEVKPFTGKESSLKSDLTSWREFIVLASKLMKWEQPYYPFIVFAVISFKFLFIWYMDPSFVTGLSLFMLFMFLMDYAIPFLSPLIFPPAGWNSSKEKEFSSACKGLQDAKSALKNLSGYLKDLKYSNPWLYVAVFSVSLSTMAWLGNQMHNLMLLYFATLVLTSLPGLASHGCLQKGSASAKKFFGRKNKAN